MYNSTPYQRTFQNYSTVKMKSNVTHNSAENFKIRTNIKSFNKNNKDLERLNRMTDYYKKNIKELPPLSKTIAAVISNASNKAAANSGPVLKYEEAIIHPSCPEFKNKEVIVHPSDPALKNDKPENEINTGFNPRFNSTANTHVLENKENETPCSTPTTIKSGRSWTSYISRRSESDGKLSKRPRCDKSLQTILTMDSFGRITEVLNSSNHYEMEETIDSVQDVETFRLSDRREQTTRGKEQEAALTRSRRWSCRSDSDVNVNVLTDGVRARVVNWLVKIDNRMGGNLTSLQCAVHFLDELSSLTERRLPDSAIACAAACYWIAIKLQHSKAPGASVMAHHADGAFGREQLVHCEKKVLGILSFPSAPLLAVDEVERIAEYWSDTAEHGLIVEGANYVCCCVLLHARLARQLAATQLAEGALAVSARALAPAHPINTYLSIMRLGENTHHDHWDVSCELERICRAISSPGCVCREPYLRYSGRKRHSVALRLSAALADSA